MSVDIVKMQAKKPSPTFSRNPRRMVAALAIAAVLTVASIVVRNDGMMLFNDQAATNTISYGFPFGYFDSMAHWQRNLGQSDFVGSSSQLQLTLLLTNLLFWFSVVLALSVRKWLMVTLPLVLMLLGWIVIFGTTRLWVWS